MYNIIGLSDPGSIGVMQVGLQALKEVYRA